jgi:hypothetical protein
LFRATVLTIRGLYYVPKKSLATGAHIAKLFLPEESGYGVQEPRKIRPPRFVSFTMELEPYSSKKAFALEILNDINLNYYEAENIQHMYTLSSHSVILTGKRIICVDE